MNRTYPPWLLVSRMLGTVALVGALATALKPGVAPPWAGPALILAFFVLRLGSEWTLALRYPDEEGRHKRSAILNTLIAVAVTAFWFYMRRRGF
ncbi:hypothetical protein [Hyalangium sp.]|uniref:hypothetical protein n=1 Tax=Hyalangium sp. TaxID=2028555 RepID=UPI002D516F57|nr:hypothetical protein [Hyalangium sp.]HYH97819.1 hypothetical protein [Hyalangium sp.]